MSENYDHENLVRAVATWRATNVIVCHAKGNGTQASLYLREARRDPDPDAWDTFTAALIDVGAKFAALAIAEAGVDPWAADEAVARDAAHGVQAAAEAAGLDADLDALLGGGEQGGEAG